MKFVPQQIENIITMIGCNRNEFLSILNEFIGDFSMSSGSYYSPYEIRIDGYLIMKYDTKGNLLYNALNK